MKASERIRDLLNQKDNLEKLIDKWEESLDKNKSEMKILTKKAWQGLLIERINTSIKSINNEIEKLENRKREKNARDQYVEQIKNISLSRVCPVCTQTVPADLIAQLNNTLKAIDYLEEFTPEDQRRLASLQSRKSHLEALEIADFKQMIESIEKNIFNNKVEIADAKQKLVEIDNDIAEFNNYGDVVALPNEYKKYIELTINTNNAINDLKEKIKTETDALTQLKNKVSNISTDVNLQSLKKKQEFCHNLINIFESGVDEFRDNLRREVEKDASDIFKRISNEPDYDHLQISTNFGLSIVHKDGGVVEIRSAGYEHIVALSLIGALHKNAPLRGPVIMDSPFGRLDPDHKGKITSVLPHLSDQIILLVYNQEINKENARILLGGNLISEFEMVRVSAYQTVINRV